jgi:hypothetical protein
MFEGHIAQEPDDGRIEPGNRVVNATLPVLEGDLVRPEFPSYVRLEPVQG